MSELYPGFADKWEDALHMRDQRFYSCVHNQAGWYPTLSRQVTISQCYLLFSCETENICQIISLTVKKVLDEDEIFWNNVNEMLNKM